MLGIYFKINFQVSFLLVVATTSVCLITILKPSTFTYLILFSHYPLNTSISKLGFYTV